MNQIFRFIDYLGTTPRINDLCKHMLNDFNLPEHPERMRIVWKVANSSLEVIGEYGYESEQDGFAGVSLGQTYPYEYWSQSKREGMEILTNDFEGPWSRVGNVYVYKLTHQFLVVGFVSLHFEDLDSAKRQSIEEKIHLFLALVNLYVVQEMQRIHLAAFVGSQSLEPVNLTLAPKSRFELLTPRQVQILRFIGEGKTNAQIGKALGYATTTIHAECSDIYQILGVASRSQAFDLIAEFLDEKEKTSLNL